MELVDLVVVNKCDGELVVPARRAAVAYSGALRLLRSVGALSDSDDGHPGADSADRAPQWVPRVLKTSSLKGDGVCTVPFDDLYSYSLYLRLVLYQIFSVYLH